MTQSPPSLSFRAQDCATRAGFSLTTLPQSLCYRDRFSSRVHWLCSARLGLCCANGEVLHQYLELNPHDFTSMHVPRGHPSFLFTMTSAHLLYCCPVLPEMHIPSFLSLQPTKDSAKFILCWYE